MDVPPLEEDSDNDTPSTSTTSTSTTSTVLSKKPATKWIKLWNVNQFKLAIALIKDEDGKRDQYKVRKTKIEKEFQSIVENYKHYKLGPVQTIHSDLR